MSSIVERIKNYADSKGVTIFELEMKAGLANATFSKAYKNNKSIRTDVLEKILTAFPGMSSDYILKGRGVMEEVKTESGVISYLERYVMDKDEIIKKQQIEIGMLYERIRTLEKEAIKIAN